MTGQEQEPCSSLKPCIAFDVCVGNRNTSPKSTHSSALMVAELSNRSQYLSVIPRPPLLCIQRNTSPCRELLITLSFADV